MKALKCEKCGAPLHGTKCEYCGTEYERDKNDDLYPINELGYLQAELNNTKFTQASVSQSCCCDTAPQIQLSQANVCSALQSGMITMNEAREAAGLMQILSRRMYNDLR